MKTKLMALLLATTLLFLSACALPKDSLANRQEEQVVEFEEVVEQSKSSSPEQTPKQESAVEESVDEATEEARETATEEEVISIRESIFDLEKVTDNIVENPFEQEDGWNLLSSVEDFETLGQLIHDQAAFSDGTRVQSGKYRLTTDLDFTNAGHPQYGWMPIGEFVWGGVALEDQQSLLQENSMVESIKFPILPSIFQSMKRSLACSAMPR